MSFDYAGRLVMVDGLAPFRHPAAYDLCSHHAESLVPPRGWRVETGPDLGLTVHAAVPADPGPPRRPAPEDHAG
jgi:hypothetical protein